jgi:hypothetical protein
MNYIQGQVTLPMTKKAKVADELLESLDSP